MAVHIERSKANERGWEEGDLTYKRPKRRRAWTGDTVRDEILQRKENGDSLAKTHVTKEDGSLMIYAMRLYGSWEAALLFAGEDPTKHTLKQGAMTQDEVLRELMVRVSNGQGLSATAVKSENNRLYYGGRRYYGKWKDVLVVLEDTLRGSNKKF